MLNELLLDSLSFIGALPDGASIIKAGSKDDEPVPVFRSAMTPAALAEMIEAAQRRSGAAEFNAVSIAAVDFLAGEGVQFDYRFMLDDAVVRRGRAVMAIVDGQLYMVQLNAVAIHYFDAALPEFEALVRSARILR